MKTSRHGNNHVNLESETGALVSVDSGSTICDTKSAGALGHVTNGSTTTYLSGTDLAGNDTAYAIIKKGNIGKLATVISHRSSSVAGTPWIGNFALYPRDLHGVTDFLVGDKNVVRASKNFLNATVETATLTSPLDIVVLYAPVNRIPRPVALTRNLLENGIPLGGSTRLVLKRGVVIKGSTSHSNFTDVIGNGSLRLNVGDYIHHVTVSSNSDDSTIAQTFSVVYSKPHQQLRVQ